MDNAILSQLKQVDVSVDKDKTKERVNNKWKAVTSSERKAFLDEYDVQESNVYRIRTVGAIMPKMALFFSEHFGINPLFLSGDIDEDTGWSKEAMEEFLVKKGYTLQPAEPSAKKEGKGKGTKKAPGKKTTAPATEASAAEPEAPANEAPLSDPANMPVEEMVSIVTSMYALAKYSASAKEKLIRVASTTLCKNICINSEKWYNKFIKGSKGEQNATS